MRKISGLFGLIAFLFAGWALADNAIVTSVTGNAQVQVGTAPARDLRQGDVIQQGATVSTGAASSLVLRFDDGQIAALTANSRMTITAYKYNPQSGNGNALLSLVSGGMRAITGLLGRVHPSQVTYRAATATIGIRGTDVTIVTLLGDVVVTVTEGAVSFTFNGQTIVIPAGQGVNAKRDGTFQQAAAQQILDQIPANLAALINGLTGLQDAINRASRGGDDRRRGERGEGGEGGEGSSGGTPGSNGHNGGAGGGGGRPSTH
jgi:uncharacterized membrane protein YgcG